MNNDVEQFIITINNIYIYIYIFIYIHIYLLFHKILVIHIKTNYR